MTQTPEYHVGQIWKSHKRAAESMFVITHVYWRQYANGDRAARVAGLLLSQEAESLNTWDILPKDAVTPGIDGEDLRDLDARSMHRMFPYLVWQSYVPEEPEDK